jgi:bla regulator protein BlaR1
MNVIFENKIFHALGMTILHSVWQIMAVFLILTIVLFVLRKSSSLIKYRILGFSMLAIFIISCFTFSYYKHKYHSGSGILPGAINLNLAGLRLHESSYKESIPSKTSLSILLNQLQSTIPYIVSVYLLGIFILSFRLLFNLYFVRRIKRFGVAIADLELQERFENLKSRILPGNCKVQLIESALVKIPVVIGYLKPLVIVPIGILTLIPYNQLEAILAHELAHIKRHDFLINILQSVVEILFFYHPVIYLISNRMRSERENCCDDFALDYCSNTQYAKALANMENLRLRNPFPAVAFVKQKENLLKRIQRILKQEKMKTKMTERLFAALIILGGFITILLTGSASLNNLSEHPKKLEFKESRVIINSQINEAALPSQAVDTSIIIEKNLIELKIEDEDGMEHDYRMEFTNDKLSSLFVDDKKVPEKDFVLYKDLISETLHDVKKARNDIDEIDEEKIRVEVESARNELEKIDMEEIRKELAKAKIEVSKSIGEVNPDSILREVHVALESIPADLNIEFDGLSIEIKAEINNAIKEIEEIDMKEVQKELEKAKIKVELEMKDIDFDEIQKSIEEALSQIDMAEIKANLQDIRVEIKMEQDNIKNLEKSLENTLKEMKAE